MRLPGSLQGRLALAVGLGIAVLWIATALVTASILRDEMNEVFDSTLEETAQRILPLAVLDIIDRDEEGVSQRIATLRPHDEFFTYVVRDSDGRVLLRSHNAQDATFPPFDGMGFRQTGTHRLYYDSALQGTITIAVAEPLSHRAVIARETGMALALPLLVLIPLSLLGIWTLVRRTLRPVRQFSAALSTRGSGDLSPVETRHLPDEITPVARAINQVMDRLRRTLEAERSFTANAAHELRTPVAAALAQTQRLISETDDAIAGRRAADIEASLKRLTRLSEKLMQLARAEGGRMRRDTIDDLAIVLQMTVTDIRRTIPTDRILLSLPDGPLLSDVDPDAFAILCRNLIENALRHGADGTPVEVRLDNDGVLHVINDGTPVSEKVLETITQRFERGGTHADGNGLGLSIVRAIAEGTDGEIEFHSPAAGRQGGFEAVYRLPAADRTDK